MDALGAVGRLQQRLVGGEVGLVDAHEILFDDGAGAQVEVPDL